jgi:hypothetical protein
MTAYDGEDFAELDTDSQIQQIAEEEVFNLSVRFKNEWQDILIDANWSNTGEGINSITLTPQREGATSYVVGSDKIQILIAEFGRRPGAKMPPAEPLREWVAEQAGLPNKGDDGFDGTVFVIRRAIAENGIEPLMAGRRAFARVEDSYVENVQRRLDDAE